MLGSAGTSASSLPLMGDGTSPLALPPRAPRCNPALGGLGEVATVKRFRRRGIARTFFTPEDFGRGFLVDSEWQVHWPAVEVRREREVAQADWESEPPSWIAGL